MRRKQATLATVVLSGLAALAFCSTLGSKAAAETAQLSHRVSTASAALSKSPTPNPATKAPGARAPARPASAEPSGFAIGQFHDVAGRSFALSRVTCLIDGRTVYSGPGGKSLQLFQGTLTPGSHTVTVQADYRLKTAGPFSYAKGFRFKVLSGRRFSVESGQPVRINAVGYERGGPTRPFDERLALAINAG